MALGFPLPGVNVKLINPKTGIEIINQDEDGEIYVSSLKFREYYNHPEATSTVLRIGWFKTGNIAYRSSHHSGAYFIRKS
jgi:long-subunit acyl-CoA synthetase (AMP-forming)